MASEDIFFQGKIDDLTDPRQLEELNQWIARVQSRVNQIDPSSLPLAWIEGYAAGAVIASRGVDVAPQWDTAPLLTGLTLSGLTASQIVMTNASKELVSSNMLGVTNGDSHDHVGGDGAQINHATLANLVSGNPHTQYMLLPMYAHFYQHNTSTPVSITVQEQWYTVSGMSAGTLRGFTFQLGQEVVASTAGTYLVVWSMSLQSESNNTGFEGTYAKNGAAETTASSHFLVQNAAAEFVISGSGILALGVGDTVSLAILNHTNTADATVEHASVSVVQIGT